MFQQNRPLFTVLEDIFPLEPVQENNYGQMADYNSNRIIPSYDARVPPPPSQQYINRIQHEYPNARSVNGMYLPRSTSYAAISQQQMEPFVQYGQFTVPPGFAGGLPYMKNAIREDQNIIMNPYGNIAPPVLENSLNTNRGDLNQVAMYPKPTKLYQPEGFRYNNTMDTKTSGTDCGDVNLHILSCKKCQMRNSYERKLWIIILIMTILVFLIIIYLLERKKQE